MESTVEAPPADALDSMEATTTNHLQTTSSSSRRSANDVSFFESVVDQNQERLRDEEEPSEKTDNDKLGASTATTNNKKTSSSHSEVRSRFGLLLVFLLLFPLLPLTISVVMGGFLSWVEGVQFEKGFLYVASNLLSMSNPLTDYNPQDPVGITIDVYISVVALLCFGIVINVVHHFYIPLWLNHRLAAFVPKRRRRAQRILVPLAAVGLVIPFLFVLVSIVFGILLGAVEGWTLKEGILYVFGNLLSLGTPLTDVLPTTLGGDLLDIFISSMALGCVAVFVDYVTSLNPGRYIGKRTQDWMLRRGFVDQDRLGSSGDAPGIFDDFEDDDEEEEDDSYDDDQNENDNSAEGQSISDDARRPPTTGTEETNASSLASRT